MHKKIRKLQAHEDVQGHMQIVKTKRYDVSNKIPI